MAFVLLGALCSFACPNTGQGQLPSAGANAPVAALLQQGVQEASQGQLAQADVTLEKAEKLAPDNVEVLSNLAKVKARVGEVLPSIALFQRVVALRPKSAEAHLDLAIALADAQKLTDALGELSKAQQLAPASPEVHLNRARLLADLHRTAEAEMEFSKAAALAPANPDCFFYWALLERETGNHAKETTLLQALVKLQPRNDEAWVLLGNSLEYQSRQQEAIASWRQALSVNPQSSQALYKLARALRTTDPEEARKLQSDFATLRQNSASLDEVKTLGNQAYAAMQSHDWPGAIAGFKRALDLCGSCTISGALHKDLGLAYCNGGQLNEGRAELQLALQLSPDDPDIARALSILDQVNTRHP